MQPPDDKHNINDMRSAYHKQDESFQPWNVANVLFFLFAWHAVGWY